MKFHLAADTKQGISIRGEDHKEGYINHLLPLLPKEWVGSFPKFITNDCLEIRLRIGQHPEFIYHKQTRYYSPSIINQEALLQIIERACQGSLYAFEEELRLGYLTTAGGHRIGFTGQAVTTSGKVQRIKHFNSLNIRIASQRIGCANSVMDAVWDPVQQVPHHTLIISPPRAGKTTLVRDITRQLSNGDPNSHRRALGIGVVDERSEIAGCYHGKPQLDVGNHTDVLDACPKAEGMMMLIRSMSPQVIVTDEIGKREDVTAIEEALNAGVRVISTAHGDSIDSLLQRPVFKELIGAKIFRRYIIMSIRNGPGTIEAIMDENCREKRRGD